MDVHKAEQQSDVGKERFTITITEHKGPFRKVVPCLPMALAGLCCLANVFIPGFDGVTRSRAVGMNLLSGFLQFITFPLVVGCVWSIIWGVLFIQIARK
uniref:Transmembrane protein n=1 Tax=Ascaris lumbricoides TaxID=6252 RepID=A0A0M3I4X7_ASCLU